jgi:hypothetical protein
MTEITDGAEQHWIGVDFDGTLAVGHLDPKPDELGEPIEPMLNFVKSLISEGRRVKIFTARVGQPGATQHIERWLIKHGIGGLEITNVKDWYCDKIYDDKAIQVVRNMGLILGMALPILIEEHRAETLDTGD